MSTPSPGADALNQLADRGSSSAAESPQESATPIVACRQCRTRKVKCDSARPQCKNCSRRSDDCEYDVIPKRRGPDKAPGTRHRLFQKKPEGYVAPKRVRRANKELEERAKELDRAMPPAVRKSANDNKRGSVDGGASNASSSTPSASGSSQPAQNDDPNPLVNLSNVALRDAELDAAMKAAGFLSLMALYHTASLQRAAINSEHDHIDNIPFSDFTNADFAVSPSGQIIRRSVSQRRTIRTVDGGIIQILNDNSYIPRGPSVSFSKQVWWENLLQLYSEDPSQSAVKIFQDISLLFNNSIYWLSFLHLPSFLEKLFDPNQRTSVQPSLVLSTLAVSTLMKSSETGLGEKGRKFALFLRDAAQSSLEASLSACWIEPSLAQAAFLLVLFESSCHPEQTSYRTSSAISLLDSLIQALGLLLVDVHEQTVSIFPANEIPVTSSTPTLTVSPTQILFPSTSTGENLSSPFLGDSETEGFTCACTWVTPGISDIPEATTRDKSQNYDLNPEELLNLNTSDDFETHRTTRQGLNKSRPTFDAGWDMTPQRRRDWPDTDQAEIQKEECRRLCWSSMLLITVLREYTPDLDGSAFELHITKQENFALFFPGEAICQGSFKPYPPKESIWALHCRAALLWNVCQNFKQLPTWDRRRAEFAGRAWTEAQAIENALAWHTCPVGRGVFHPGREYIFQLKLMISKNFTRFIPLPHTMYFERDSAEEWLQHRQEIANHVRKMVYFVARFGASAAALTMAKRPLSVWWALYQLRTGVLVWKSDPTLTRALEQSLDFLAITDFMTMMWPNTGIQKYYSGVKQQLMEACTTAGISIPASVPIPGLSHATMTPSPSLPLLPTNADIQMLPLD